MTHELTLKWTRNPALWLLAALAGGALAYALWHAADVTADHEGRRLEAARAERRKLSEDRERILGEVRHGNRD